MSHRRIISAARNDLHDLLSDLHGIQLDTSSEIVAAKVAAARADIERGMGWLTDLLNSKLDS